MLFTIIHRNHTNSSLIQCQYSTHSFCKCRIGNRLNQIVNSFYLIALCIVLHTVCSKYYRSRISLAPHDFCGLNPRGSFHINIKKQCIRMYGSLIRKHLPGILINNCLQLNLSFSLKMKAVRNKQCLIFLSIFTDDDPHIYSSSPD